MPLARRLHVHRASPSVSCLYASKAEFDNLSGIPSREIRKIFYGLCAWSITKFPDICIVDGYPIYLTAFGKPRDTFREIVHKSSVAKSTSKASKGMIGGIPVCCRSLLEIAFVIY